MKFDEVNRQWIWSTIKMPISVILFIIAWKQRDFSVSSSIIDEILWLRPCAPEEEFIPDTKTEWQREKRAREHEDKVGEVRGFCEEQMVSGCKHISTFISREAQWGDVFIFLLTIHCLFVRDSSVYCIWFWLFLTVL